MKLICYESLKLFHTKSVWYTIITIFFINAALLYYQISHTNSDGYSLREVASIYDYIKEGDMQEQLLLLEAEIKTYHEQVLVGSEYSIGRDNAVRMIYNRIDMLSHYDEYLEGIKDQGERMKYSIIFGAPDTYSYRNIIRASAAYSHMGGTKLTVDIPDGVNFVTDNRLTDVMIVICLCVLTMHALIVERDIGLLPLIKPRKYGLCHTMLAKLVTLLIATVILVFVFYFANIGITSSEIGLGTLSRPVQTLERYFTSPYRMSVGEYLAVLVPAKILVFFAFICVFSLTCVITKSSVLACLTAALILGVEFLLWNNISFNSWLSLLKQFNCVALFDVGGYICNYININIFGYPLNILTTGIITALIQICGGVALCLYFYINESSLNSRQQSMLKMHDRLSVKSIGLHFSLLCHEAYKILIINKGFQIVLIFLIVQFFLANQTHYYIDTEEYFYKNYSEILSGEITLEKMEFLESKQSKFDNSESEREILYARYNSGEIDADYLDYALTQTEVNGFEKRAFERAKGQYSRLETLNVENIPAAYVYETPWEKVLGPKSKNQDLTNLAKLFLVLILILSPSEAMEHVTGMDMIMVTTTKGRNAATRRKLIICFGLCVLCTSIAFLPSIFVIYQKFGFTGIDAPVMSVLNKAIFPATCTLMLALVLKLVFMLFLSFAGSTLILAASRKTSSPIAAMLISSAVLLLPIISLCML